MNRESEAVEEALVQGHPETVPNILQGSLDEQHQGMQAMVDTAISRGHLDSEVLSRREGLWNRVVVAGTVATPAEVEEELRTLRQILAG